MSLEQIVTDYGALGLFLGAGVEGEAVAMLGGILSHRGLADIWTAIPAVALGAFLVDQMVFIIGRRGRNRPRVVALRQGPAGARVVGMFNRHPDVFTFAFRFAYGLRIASALTIGATDYSHIRFMLLNAAAALTWATMFVGLGFLCGQTIEAVFGRLHPPRHFLIAGVAVVGIVGALAHFMRKR